MLLEVVVAAVNARVDNGPDDSLAVGMMGSEGFVAADGFNRSKRHSVPRLAAYSCKRVRCRASAIAATRRHTPPSQAAAAECWLTDSAAGPSNPFGGPAPN